MIITDQISQGHLRLETALLLSAHHISRCISDKCLI